MLTDDSRSWLWSRTKDGENFVAPPHAEILQQLLSNTIDLATAASKLVLERVVVKSVSHEINPLIEADIMNLMHPVVMFCLHKSCVPITTEFVSSQHLFGRIST